MGVYLADRRAEGIASADRQADAWKAMRHFWEDVPVKLIDEDMAKGYSRQRNRAEATVRYELGLLAVALRYTRRKKLIEVAPEIWRPERPERRDRHLTREQFRRFLAEVKAPHAILYMKLAIATGARPSALLDLTWDRVDFARGLLDLNPRERRQTAKRRPTVPMADWIKPVLEEAYTARQCAHVIERGGKRIASIKKAFAAASERSNVYTTPYTLRHSAAIWKAEDGVPMSELAQFLGHEDSVTTERYYAKYSPEYLRKAANAGQF